MVITQSSTCIFPFNHGDFTLKRVNITEGDSLVSCDHVLGSEAVLCFQNKTQCFQNFDSSAGELVDSRVRPRPGMSTLAHWTIGEVLGSAWGDVRVQMGTARRA